MTDPFNRFLQMKIADFRRRSNPELLYTELTNVSLQPSRETAALVNRPLTQTERMQLTEQQREEEDARLLERADYLAYEKTANQVMELFSV